jgi:hypothetical protein
MHRYPAALSLLLFACSSAATGSSGEPSKDAPEIVEAPTDASAPPTQADASDSGSPYPGTFTVVLDGYVMTSGSFRISTDRAVDGYMHKTAILQISGPTTPPGSTLLVSARAAGSGCNATGGTSVTYIAGGYRSFFSTDGMCGLTIKRFDDARIAGVFSGAVSHTGSDGVPDASANVVVTFDLPIE